MSANRKLPMLHNEGLTTRNYTAYNFEVLRDDIYMLGIDGTVTKHRIAPTRSTCAVVVSSQNANRDWIYYMQQTISAEGFSGFAFSTYYPHTVRATETKMCTDCHVSREGDNNAWMAQLLMQGTNLVNFMGRYVYVAEGSKGFEAVTVAEQDDPPAVFGSDLQKLVYSKDYDEVEEHHGDIHEGDHHAGNVLDLQLRGEYLYAALGKDGFRVYDVANIDNKDFSEKMVTAPVSPLGQRLYVKTKNAMAIASPSTLAVDPLRTRIPANEEQPIALMYGFLYVADAEEGLVVIGDPDLKSKAPGVLTLLDGNPANNFLKRATTFNPNNVLKGARRITRVGGGQYCKSAGAQSRIRNRSTRSGGRARDRRPVPLRLCSRSPGVEGSRRHLLGAPARGSGRKCSTRRRPQYLHRPNLRLRRGRQAGFGDRRCGAARASEDRPGFYRSAWATRRSQ
jgi:hypothetical protein